MYKRQDKKSAINKIKAMLLGVKTVEEAIELWPEVKEYLEVHLETTYHLPAVDVESVREALKQLAA